MLECLLALISSKLTKTRITLPPPPYCEWYCTGFYKVKLFMDMDMCFIQV